METARASIIDGGIDDIFWPEVILAMTSIKKIRPTSALKGHSPHQKLFNSPPDPTHLRVLGSVGIQASCSARDSSAVRDS